MIAACKSSVMASGRKASSRAGPKYVPIVGKSWSSAGGNGKSHPAWIKQLEVSPCYSIREWSEYGPFYLLFL